MDDYLESLAVRNYSPKTIESRRLDLGAFLRWCQERDLLLPDQLSRPIIESYQRWMHRHRKKNGKPLGFTTQRGRLASIKDYCRWLCRQNYALHNPASELEMPRGEKKLPEVALTVDEVERILAVPDLGDPLGIRDRAMLEVFYSSGIRRMELVRLQLPDVHAERGMLMIRQGKGKKDRVTPIGARALGWVERYLGEVRPELVVGLSEKALFLSAYGEAFNADVVTRMVADYIRRADIGRSGSCHLLRHTCATLMLENGADIRHIQQLLGHANLSTTQIYTEVSIRQLQKVHELTHPAKAGEK